jgi:excisionase family DNA binding protein
LCGERPLEYPAVSTVTDPPAPPPLLVDSRRAAKLLSVSERTVWSITAPRGPLPAVRIGRAVRYSVEAIRAYVEAQQTGAAGVAP